MTFDKTKCLVRPKSGYTFKTQNSWTLLGKEFAQAMITRYGWTSEFGTNGTPASTDFVRDLLGSNINS